MGRIVLAIFGISVACLCVSGCSHNAEAPTPTVIDEGTVMPNTSFLAALRSISPEQRQAYVQQHPSQVGRIMQGNNQTEKIEYTLMMKAK